MIGKKLSIIGRVMFCALVVLIVQKLAWILDNLHPDQTSFQGWKSTLVFSLMLTVSSA